MSDYEERVKKRYLASRYPHDIHNFLLLSFDAIKTEEDSCTRARWLKEEWPDWVTWA